jgi:small conductance mechanosensitive channel
MRLLRSNWDEFEDWLTHSGKDIAIVLGVLFAVFMVFRLTFPRVARAAMMRGAHPADEEMEKRAGTIIGVIDRTAGIAVLLVAVVTVLPEIGVDITAIVTGLGITGLALALGAQALVRDAINGIFLLAEDQYRTGDVIRIADVTGTVEAITLRRTIIRDEDGVVHSVPNGSISVVSNFTRDFARVNLPARVAYGEDMARVDAVIGRVAQEIMGDPHFGPLLMETPRAERVESVGETGVTVTVSARTRPAARWEVESELRRRLAEAFVAEGVRVPFPQVPREPGEV